MIDNNDENKELNEIVNTLMKKSKQMLSQHSSIWVIDENKFESFIFIIIFDCDLISFDVNQLVTRKKITKLKVLNVELESMNLNCLKSMLLFCFRSETQKVLKNVDVSFNCSEVVNISKNLWFMFFSISVNVNNINKLCIADRKYWDILNVLNDYIEVLKLQEKISWS